VQYAAILCAILSHTVCDNGNIAKELEVTLPLLVKGNMSRDRDGLNLVSVGRSLEVRAPRTGPHCYRDACAKIFVKYALRHPYLHSTVIGQIFFAVSEKFETN